jgi:hypothetical protein
MDELAILKEQCQEYVTAVKMGDTLQELIVADQVFNTAMEMCLGKEIWKTLQAIRKERNDPTRPD